MCIFCKIAKGEMPANKVYEDDNFVAFLDISPANNGHTLVITKEHYETFTDIPEDKLKEFTAVTQKVAVAVKDATSCHGYNIIMNNNKAAGQIVPHVHYHIVPRVEGDNVLSTLKQGNYKEGEMEEYSNAIKSKL
ncbi:MAG: HIT family protein [Nanobdellota archaeon]